MRVDDPTPRMGTPLRVVSCASPSAGAGSESEDEDEDVRWERESEQAGRGEERVGDTRWGEGNADQEREGEDNEAQDEDVCEEDEREGEMWKERIRKWKRGVVQEMHDRLAREGGFEVGGGKGGNGVSTTTYFERLAEEGRVEDDAGGFFRDALWEGGL